MNNKDKKNLRFIFTFSVFLFLGIYILSNSGDKKINYTPKSTNQNPWISADYGKAKKYELDIKRIQEALVNAKSPEDFEEKVNAIYQGEEIISIHVKSTSPQAAIVTLYIDKEPINGKMEEKERILSLEKSTENQQNKIAVTGYGNYSHYSSYSPFFYSMAGSMAGSMIGNWLSSKQYSYSTPLSRQKDIKDFKAPLREKTWGSKSNRGSWKSKSNTSSRGSFFSNKTKSRSSSGWGSRGSRRSFFGGSRRGFGGFRGFRGFRR